MDLHLSSFLDRYFSAHADEGKEVAKTDEGEKEGGGGDDEEESGAAAPEEEEEEEPEDVSVPFFIYMALTRLVIPRWNAKLA